MTDPLISPDDRSRDVTQPLDRLGPNERLKADSRALRGTLAQSLAEPLTGALPSADDQIVIKFHGIYQEDDRDLRDERRRQKLEPAYEFLIRLRLPGGVCRPDQWLVLDDLARTHANRTLRLTTRQTVQFHGVLKRDLKRVVAGMHTALVDSIGACGDLVRGVMAPSLPDRSDLHGRVYDLAARASGHFLPKTRAYHEIFLGETRVAGGEPEEEPILGRTYLPRKFKIGFAVPPDNDVDIYTQDLGFVAIEDGGTLAGFTVLVGGGMGRTDGDETTFARIADPLIFCRPEQVIEVAEAIVGIQRDFGDRATRKHARLKYTIAHRGLDWFRVELARRLGHDLAPPRPFAFTANTDRFGWIDSGDGTSAFTVFVENGRLAGHALDGLREIARIHAGTFRLTANQNLIIAGIATAERERIAALLAEYGLDGPEAPSLLRRNAMACVALPTCTLAMAEAERALPGFLTRLETLVAGAGLADQPITVRMTGCPNGCARPYVAEIGLTGRGPGTYALYLGGGGHGERLGERVLDNADTETILATLAPLLTRYAAERAPGERFGDFVVRTRGG